MNTSLDDLIREKLACYLFGEQTIEQFEEWFVPATWNSTGRVAPWTQDLIGEVELRLAELSSGHRTEDELRDYFTRAISQRTIGQPAFTSSATGNLTRASYRLQVESGATAAPVLLSATGSW